MNPDSALASSIALIVGFLLIAGALWINRRPNP